MHKSYKLRDKIDKIYVLIIIIFQLYPENAAKQTNIDRSNQLVFALSLY